MRKRTQTHEHTRLQAVKYGMLTDSLITPSSMRYIERGRGGGGRGSHACVRAHMHKQAVYGNVTDKLRSNFRTMHPLLESIMVEHIYGRTLSRSEGRTGAPIRERAEKGEHREGESGAHRKTGAQCRERGEHGERFWRREIGARDSERGGRSTAAVRVLVLCGASWCGLYR